MKVACSGCGSGYVVDESSAAEEFLCASCGTPIELERFRPPRETEARATRPEVVCPRCKMRFDPTARPWSAEHQPTVLIVADHGFFRTVAEQALSARCSVKSSASVPEALAILAAGDIDLMVLDVTLNGADQGTQFLRQLRHKPCPILIFSDRDEQALYGAEWQALRKLGADDIVIQGMHAGESLARKVSAMLGLPLDDEDESD
jgi:CheY-like chemotaxis protein